MGGLNWLSRAGTWFDAETNVRRSKRPNGRSSITLSVTLNTHLQRVHWLSQCSLQSSLAQCQVPEQMHVLQQGSCGADKHKHWRSSDDADTGQVW